MGFIEVESDKSYLVKDDPVRPELTYQFRITNGRKIFCLENNNNIDAVICVAFNHQVPKTVSELDHYSHPDFFDPNAIAVFYTVWSYNKGAGRKIIFDAVDWLKRNRREVMRFVTLSPKTEMAKKFHLSNGARILSLNDQTDNYEYHL